MFLQVMVKATFLMCWSVYKPTIYLFIYLITVLCLTNMIGLRTKGETELINGPSALDSYVGGEVMGKSNSQVLTFVSST